MPNDMLTLTRVAPTTFAAITVNRGEKVGFAAEATSSDSLRGLEWYQRDHFIGHTYAPANVKEAELWCDLAFPLPGSVKIGAVAFDPAERYSDPVSWTVEVAERPRLLYEDQVAALLDEPGTYWDFISQWRVNHLALYGLRGILPGRASELRNFITEARLHGVTRIFAAVGACDVVQKVGDYLDTPDAPSSGRFDGLLTEYEFWSTDPESPYTWEGYLRLLDCMRVLADERKAACEELVLATYLGWPDEQEAKELRERVDLVLLSAYVDEPDNVFGHLNLEDRLQNLARGAGRPLEVWPIFSAEGCPEGGDFMGPWFAAPRSDPLETAEATVLEAYGDPDGGPTKGLRLAGFAYFKRDLLAEALADPHACP